MRLEDLTEDSPPTAIMHLVREDLEKLEYTRLRWQCHCEGCEGGTHVRDYGISPWYFLDRNSKRSWEDPDRYWLQLQHRTWLCSKHWPVFSQLIKLYDFEHVCARMGITARNGINKLSPIDPAR